MQTQSSTRTGSLPFEEYASRYDAEFTDTPLGRELREIVRVQAARTFARCKLVLELGCGTGEDALWLAEQGKQVLACDAAAEMIRIAQWKTERGGRAKQVDCRQLRMEDASAELPHGAFDGVFSNFGAVNCVADLPALVKDIASLLPPQAPLLWVVMGRHVPWEWFWYLSRGRLRKAFRRLGKVEWRGISVYYPTPADAVAALEPHFDIQSVRPLGAVLPPSYAGDWLNRHPRILAAMAAVERGLHAMSLGASLSDHYVVEALRR